MSPPFPPPPPTAVAGGSSTLAAPPAGPSASSVALVKPPGVPCPPFEYRHGRRWINTSSIYTAYPLPVDARELARQTLLHRLFYTIHGAHHCSPLPPDRQLRRILDLGCGTGLWCADMSDTVNKHNREVAARMGEVPVMVEMVGIDLVPVYTDMTGVRFTFMQHNFLGLPLPFDDGSFDFVLIRDGALAATSRDVMGGILDEMVRVLVPGGFYEIHTWDLVIRCLNPPTASSTSGTSSILSVSTSSTSSTTPPPFYPITSTTTLHTSTNPYTTLLNDRLVKTLSNLDLPPFPVTIVPPALTMIPHSTLVGSRKLALPLDEVTWENPNGGITTLTTGTTSSSSSHTSSSHPPHKGSFQRPPPPPRSRAGSQADGKSVRSAASTSDIAGAAITATDPIATSVLTPHARATRKIARMVYVGVVEALEPMIKRECGIDDEDWDRWWDEAKWDWFENGGWRNGECLEMGAWWGVKDLEGG
ncbi:hypothetical protein EX30DRAFT_368392 [Ascodesmis nigricans]|uniref:Methyltransferase domain-containing protein n=1 Tax=Ascodesmis nigricans TaxID=341454 RepID=A0A4V3SJT9_9PEZI|nr:hypothetical protein EX30DRAFT_368392 [Ascodesmis nigricans]